MDVFDSESQWLNDIVLLTSVHTPTNGNTDAILEEIDQHQVFFFAGCVCHPINFIITAQYHRYINACSSDIKDECM